MHDGPTNQPTIEGLGDETQLVRHGSRFRETRGFQCGYCTPVKSVQAPPCSKSSKPVALECFRGACNRVARAERDAEISERMSGNIVACAPYANIVDAIRETAKEQS